MKRGAFVRVPFRNEKRADHVTVSYLQAAEHDMHRYAGDLFEHLDKTQHDGVDEDYDKALIPVHRRAIT